MAKPPKKMPEEALVPPGPRRDLLELLHRFYSANGARPLRTVSRQSKTVDGEPLSEERLKRILDGDTDALLNKRFVESFIWLMTDQPDDLQAFNDRWTRFHDHHRSFGEAAARQPGRRQFHRDLVPSAHFAKHAFDARKLVDPPPATRWGRANASRIRGSVAVMANEFDILTTGRTVFDPSFQGTLSQSVEYGLLRGGTRQFMTLEAWHPTSFAVFGALPYKGSNEPDGTFICIEAHDRGAVSVYFEERRARPISQILSWWVVGAVQAAMFAHSLLGSSGQADLTVLLDTAGIDDMPPNPYPTEPPRAARGGAVPGTWGRVDDSFIYDYLTDISLPRYPREDRSLGESIAAAWDIVEEWQRRWNADPKRPSPASLSANLWEMRERMEHG